jgi:uroporphyrin-III C-methyltransferase/precorrin-2 dehydrogenase/sirohydrochlorin ferrochelatase
MQHFPIFLDLRGRRAVVLGGGAEAARKIELLLRAGARPLVVAAGSELSAEVRRWAAEGRCELQAGPFRAAWLMGAALAISASGDPEQDARFVAAARAQAVLVNVVDRPELSSFIMPAIVDRAPVTVAVSTGGASPTLAQLVRDRIERLLPRDLGKLAALAATLRPLVRMCVPDQRRRRRFWRRTLAGRVEALAFADEGRAAEHSLLSVLGHESGAAEARD